MDLEYQIIRNLRGPIGMSNVRCLQDLYVVKPEKLAKRLTGVMALSPESLVSVYAEWLQYRLISDERSEKLSSREKSSLISGFCQFALSVMCTISKRKEVWNEAVQRAVKTAGKHTRTMLRTRHIRQDIQACFDKADMGGAEHTFSTAHYAPRNSPSRSEVVSQIAPRACDSHRDAKQLYGHKDDWGCVPDESYQCPICRQFGHHFAMDCPQSRHVNGDVATQATYNEQDRLRDEAARMRKALEIRWNDQPPTHFRCGLCDMMGAHWEPDCPEVSRLTSVFHEQTVNEQAHLYTAKDHGSAVDVRPTIELAGCPSEPGEIFENKVSQKDSSRRVEGRGTKRPQASSSSTRGDQIQGDPKPAQVTSSGAHEPEVISREPLSKRLRMQDESFDAGYFFDTSGGWGCPTPTPAQARIQLWQSTIQTPDIEKTTSCEIFDVTNGDSRPASRSGVSTSAVAVTATEGGALHTETPPTEMTEIPSHVSVGIRSESQDPTRQLIRLETVDLTARPISVALRSRCKAAGAGLSGHVNTSEADDLTDAINALEKADGFLKQLANTHGALPPPIDYSSLASQDLRNGNLSASRLPTHEIAVSGNSSPASVSTGAFYSCVEDEIDAASPECASNSASSLLEGHSDDPESPASLREERQVEEEHMYDPCVLELFRGRAPPQLHIVSRTTAVSMWEQANTAEAAEEVPIVDEESDDSDIVRVKPEAENDVPDWVAWFNQAPSSSEYSSSDEETG
ncbi:hypothetical protein LIA77_07270 [Sarocladium implicatum]|nr:hypothetical protein LIA77_07270 [Sarocladium implicatum]